MRIEHYKDERGSFGWLDSVYELTQVAPNAKYQSQLVELVNKGWSGGADRIEKTLNRLEVPPVQGVRRRPTWSDNGDEVNLDRIRAGQLDTAWHGVKRRLGGQPPRIRIVADASMLTMGTPPEVFFIRGAACVRLGDSLNEAGYQVELWASDGVAGRKEERPRRPRTGFAYVVKPFSAPFDMATAAAGCANSEVFQLLGYSMFCVVNERACGGGTPMIPDFFEEENTRVFIVPDTVLNAEAAHDWMNACIRTLEVSYEAERAAHL